MATRAPENFLNSDSLSSKSKLVVKTPLTQRRYTPYTKSNQRGQGVTKTPLPSIHQRRSHTTQGPKHKNKQQRSVELSKDTSRDISTIIANKSWRVYRVSPLYCFKTDEKSLKLYERRLNSFLAVETSGITSVPSLNTRKKSTFSIFKGDTEGDYGVEIKLITNEGNENASKEELCAVLCCMGSVKTVLKSNLSSLPVCLIKSSVLLKDLFLQWLENEFGCRACPLLFSPTDLAWLASLCIGIGEPTTSIEFTYSVPAVVPDLDTITFKMDAKDARRIWNLVHNPKQPFFTNDEAIRILKSMETHFYHHFKVHLNQMQLKTVGTSVAYIGHEGRIKFFQEPYVCYILQQLIELANT
ncbi:centromere protein L-like [Dendronephthya gigantea]|uniref:centromere protein L-like n=1 Tax=Dendronephthya gigantea TaxID=151771 RepID=UPI00106A64D3|nr:centromere protein L-like [Dendronephthya gigantea]